MQEVFNTLYAKQGGYIDPYPAYGGIRYEDIVDFIMKCTIRRSEKAPRIFVGFYNNTRLGASVKKGDDKCYYIGISSGSITVFRRLFARLLCSPKVLPEYGASQFEKVKKLFNTELRDATQFLLAPDDDEVWPKDSERQGLVEILTAFGLGSLVLHELGHIMRGHVDFKHSLTGELSWSEITLDHSEAALPSSLSPLYSQTLEYDADSYAVSAGVKLVIDMHRGKEQVCQFINDDLGRYYDRPEALIELWIFAMTAAFKLFGKGRGDAQQWMKSSHPLPAARIVILTGTAMEYYAEGPNTRQAHNNDEALINRCKKAIANAYAGLEVGFVEISESDLLDVEHIKEMHNQTEYYNWLEEGWNEIRDKLQTFAFEELPGPSEMLTRIDFDKHLNISTPNQT